MTAPRHLPHDWFARPLPPNVEIGARSWLYSTFAFVHYQSRRPTGLRVGHDSGIYTGTFFDLGVAGEVDIGDYCSLVGVIVSTNGRVVIGDYCLIAHEVVIADVFAPVPPTAANAQPGADQSPAITIGPLVWIGARALLVGEIQIGEGAIVGAGAVVTSDVAPYTVVAGNPAREVKRLRRP